MAGTATEAASLRWILIAKGIGILLVVIGHFQPPEAPAWWSALCDAIYGFHMPFFFLMSGFLYQHGKYAYRELLRGKVARLLYPFVSVAAIFFFLKLGAASIATLEHPITPSSLIDLLLDPAGSFVPLLWFVHALFLIFVVYPPLRALLRSDVAILLLALVVNSVLPNEYLGLNRVLAHLPFFAAGAWLGSSGLLAGPIRAKPALVWALGASVVFIALYLPLAGMDISEPRLHVARVMLGLAGSAGVIGLAIWIDQKAAWMATFWAATGFYSMTIYLLHTLFESGVRVAAFQIAGLPASMFVPVALVAVAAGVVFPFVLEKYVLRRFQVTRRLILGLDPSRPLLAMPQGATEIGRTG